MSNANTLTWFPSGNMEILEQLVITNTNSSPNTSTESVLFSYVDAASGNALMSFPMTITVVKNGSEDFL